MEPALRVGNVGLYQADGEGAVAWVSGMGVDADGSPRAYHPNGPNAGALDYTANAGKPGNWYGLVTVDGNPVVQGASDPAPGFYVSPTSLEDPTKARTDPRRYVDASTVPYLVLPPEVRDTFEISLGDLAVVANGRRGLTSAAIFADIGPRGKIGEGSVALATQLGINNSARNGGTSGDILFVVFPGSGGDPAWPRSPSEIISNASQLFSQWGGIPQLISLFPQYKGGLTALAAISLA
jgi:hypothetical protein